MDELKLSGKPFDISKAEVWNAWIKVKGTQGAAGVDGQSLTEFEADLKTIFTGSSDLTGQRAAHG